MAPGQAFVPGTCVSFQPWHIKATDALIFSPPPSSLPYLTLNVDIFVWPRSPRPFSPALSVSPIEVGCRVSPEVGPGKLLVPCWWGVVERLEKTKLAIPFNAKETVGSHQCWCELVQRKTGIKVMSSGSVYAESIPFQAWKAHIYLELAVAL